MTFTYRTARGSDATACAKIIREWGDDTQWMVPLDSLEPMASWWRALLETETAWVAQKDRRVVGFCVREDDNISGLYVASDAQSCGVGKALLDLAKVDREWITVWAFEKNVLARKFYRREGLVEVGREQDANTGLVDVEHRWTRAK